MSRFYNSNSSEAGAIVGLVLDGIVMFTTKVLLPLAVVGAVTCASIAVAAVYKACNTIYSAGSDLFQDFQSYYHADTTDSQIDTAGASSEDVATDGM